MTGSIRFDHNNNVSAKIGVILSANRVPPAFFIIIVAVRAARGVGRTKPTAPALRAGCRNRPPRSAPVRPQLRPAGLGTGQHSRR